jgi:hypothetical protein
MPADRPEGGVQLRTLLVAGMPLLVLSIASDDTTGVREAIADAGVGPIESFVGRSLPRGARVGLVTRGDTLRLVDERDRALLTAARTGLDANWLAGARRLKGTMLVQVDDLDLAPRHDAATLAGLLDRSAATGRARGAVVGFAEDRGSLPLLFG